MRPAASLRGYVSKAPDWDSQDAFAENPERGRFAVADGMTHASYMSKQFAQTVVDTFVSSGVNPIEDFVVGEPPADSPGGGGGGAAASGPVPVPWFGKQLRKVWRKEIEDLYLPEAKEFLRAKWTNGESASHATFAGIQCTEPGHAVQVLIVGDCYVFVCPVGADVRGITGAGTSPRDAPRSVSVGATDRREVFDHAVVESVPLGGVSTYVLLCTDWIGRRLALAAAAHPRGWPPVFKRLVDIRQQSEFMRWVVEARRADTSGDPPDDVTLLIVRVNASASGVSAAARPLDLAGIAPVPAPVANAPAAPPPTNGPAAATPDAAGVAAPAIESAPAKTPGPEPQTPAPAAAPEPPQSSKPEAPLVAGDAPEPPAPNAALAPGPAPPASFDRAAAIPAARGLPTAVWLAALAAGVALLFAARRDLEATMLLAVGAVGGLLLLTARWVRRHHRPAG